MTGILSTLSENALVAGGLAVGLVVVIWYLYANYSKEGFVDMISDVEKINAEAQESKYGIQNADQMNADENMKDAVEITEEAIQETEKVPDSMKHLDLLPNDEMADEFAMGQPSVPGELSQRNFLEAPFLTGTDTQGGSLKNSNLSIRSDPVIPQVVASVWNQSTYQRDVYRKDFEIGQ